MVLNEYIYVNNRRLDAYFEQISSPLAYDKVPSIKVKLSLTGLEVGGEQSQNARAFSMHEKISKLQTYLKGHNQILNHSPFIGQSEAQPFVLESLYAKRVFIPPKSRAHDREIPEWFKGLSLWISTRPVRNDGREDGRTFLFEEAFYADSKIETASAYSALTMLRNEFVPLSEFTVAAQTLVCSKSDQDESNLKFSENPLEFLAGLGAIIASDERLITSLYRLRTYFLEPTNLINGKKWKPNVVGYPIFITAGSTA